MRFIGNKYSFLFFILLGLLSCQPDDGPGTENVIPFVDVIGTYEGECADLDPDTNEMMNREVSSISVFAIDQNTGGVNTSCARFDDYELPLKTTTAAKIVFEKNISANASIVLTYYSASDSVTLINIGTMEGDMIFSGVRK